MSTDPEKKAQEKFKVDKAELKAEREAFEAEKEEAAEKINEAKAEQELADKRPQKWIFESAGRKIVGVVIKPTTYQGVPDGRGSIAFMKTIKAVYLQFNVNGRAVVDEAFAKRNGYPASAVAVIAQWVIEQPFFGRRYFLIHSPDMTLSVEELKKLEEDTKPKRTGPKQQTGVRTTGGK